jgi:cell division protein FtsN
MKKPMLTTVVAIALGLGALAGCAAEAEPTDSSSEEGAKSQQPSQPESASAVPKVEDGTVGVETAKLPPAQRCYNNCRRGGLRDDFCSSACGW